MQDAWQQAMRPAMCCQLLGDGSVGNEIERNES
jgi:hypothetical protein